MVMILPCDKAFYLIQKREPTVKSVHFLQWFGKKFFPS